MTTIQKRRQVFYEHFPMIQIGKPMHNHPHVSTIKNSCPACGFLTLMSRGGYDICPVCFWEDNGADDYNVDELNDTNNHTLNERREIVAEQLQEIRSTYYEEDDIRAEVKKQLLKIDAIIDDFSEDRKRELYTEQGKFISLFTVNGIFGLEDMLNRD